MEKYLDVIRRILELSETCNEGVDYIIDQVKKGNMKQAMPMVHDVMNAFGQMQNSFSAIEKSVSVSPTIVEYAKQINDVFVQIDSAYTQSNDNHLSGLLYFSLGPKYKQWYTELYKSLSKYTLM